MLDRLRRLIPGLGTPAPVVPVVRVAGPIGMVMPFRPGVTMASLASALDRAFAVKDAPAVAIVINSPGGSPVQSHLIHRRIRALAEEKNRRVLVFVEDAAASGGYMIACAGDEIIADPSSIVGSIGVVSQGFGFVGLIDKLGVERRVHTSGGRKAILDPFRPERPEDVDHLLQLQEEVHEGFADLVKARRGSLLADNPELFSGLFWTGRTALGLGLVDELGDLRTALRARFGDKVRTRLYGGERSWPWRRSGLGVDGRIADELIAAVEARTMWARYGL